jgi:hypothetical protein
MFLGPEDAVLSEAVSYSYSQNTIVNSGEGNKSKDCNLSKQETKHMAKRVARLFLDADRKEWSL